MCIMKQVVYHEILRLMRKHKTRDALPRIAEKYPGVTVSAVGSIFSQDYQRKMRKTHHIHYNAEAVATYNNRFNAGLHSDEKAILLNLSEELDLSPALLARIILERYLTETKFGGDCPPKSYVTQLMKEPSQIEDPLVAMEIHECVLADDHYGPLCDSIKQSIGHEYEYKLNRTLDMLGLPYLGEDQMRSRGYDKTPDVKLEVPIAVDGHVVNWIESKASFGDEHSHRTYLKEQFWSYWNRFGPGMVIYWFGFIEELDTNKDQGIILCDNFPQTFTRMDPVLAW